MYIKKRHEGRSNINEPLLAELFKEGFIFDSYVNLDKNIYNKISNDKGETNIIYLLQIFHISDPHKRIIS